MQITTDEFSYLLFYQIEAQMKLALQVDITEKSGRLVPSNQVPGNRDVAGTHIRHACSARMFGLGARASHKRASHSYIGVHLTHRRASHWRASHY
jgi:hypothetical protein